MGISAGESRDKSRSISRDKNHPELTEVWSRSQGMGEGKQEENRTSNLLHIHCVPQEQTERELSVLEEVGCKAILLNGHYVLSKSIVSWSPGLTISHCGKCKGQFVKSQFSRSLPSFSVSRTVPPRMFCSRCLGCHPAGCVSRWFTGSWAWCEGT